MLKTTVNWFMGFKNQGVLFIQTLRVSSKTFQVDAELSKELEQWNEMLRNDVVKLCQENNFNTGFFEGNDTYTVVDAYELKVHKSLFWGGGLVPENLFKIGGDNSYGSKRGFFVYVLAGQTGAYS